MPKENLVILIVCRSNDVRGLVKMAGLGRNYPSVGKGRSNSNGYGGMLTSAAGVDFAGTIPVEIQLNWSDEIT